MVSLPEVVGKGYGTFWNFKGRYRVCKGSRASKKSKTTALNSIVRMMQYPQANLLCVRKVFRTLKDSCFTELKWAIRRLGVEVWWDIKESPLEMTYRPTGQKILFRGLDDPLKVTSLTVEVGVLCWMWIEEAYEITSEADFDTLDEGIRGEMPPGLFKQITLTFNPWSEHHWIKARFFDSPDSETLALTTNYLCNEWLDDADRKVFEAMKQNNPRRYRVAGLGDWGISEGLIYDRWEISAFDWRALGEKDESEWQYKTFFGLDYGYTNDPTAFIGFSCNPISKEIYVFDEFYKTKMLNSEIAAEIKRKGYAKERIRADSAEPKSNDDIRRLGISRIQPAAKGKDSVNNGIAAIQEYRIIVHPQCKNTISELSSYCWKKDKSDHGINVPEDQNNHLMDAMRYAFYDVKFFRPQDPDCKRKLTQQERFERKSGMTSDDFLGGWS